MRAFGEYLGNRKHRKRKRAKKVRENYEYSLGCVSLEYS